MALLTICFSWSASNCVPATWAGSAAVEMISGRESESQYIFCPFDWNAEKSAFHSSDLMWSICCHWWIWNSSLSFQFQFKHTRVYRTHEMSIQKGSWLPLSFIPTSCSLLEENHQQKCMFSRPACNFLPWRWRWDLRLYASCQYHREGSWGIWQPTNHR